MKSKQMKAAYLTGQMKMEIRSQDIPNIPPGGALLKVHSTGLCGSDINRIRYTTSDEGRVLGHEITGEIVHIDPNVTDFQVGDQVAIGHVHIPCMHCDYCRHGSPAMCRQFKAIRVEPGGYAEFVALTYDHLAHSVVRIPEGVSHAEATFIDPLGCCLAAVNKSQVRPFDRAVVVGTGIMGQLFVMLLSQMQVEAIAVDISQYRLDKALEFGAVQGIAADRETLTDEILQATQGKGADTVFLTYLNQQILDEALAYVRDGGNLCVFAPPVNELNLKIDYFSFFRRELNMFSSYSSKIDEIEDTLKWISSKKVPVEKLITGTCNLEGILETVQNLTDKDFKVIVNP